MLSPAFSASREPCGELLQAAAAATEVDPIFVLIEQHKRLVIGVNTMPEPDCSSVFQAACEREEAALQALGDMVPTSIQAAAAQLAYMAQVEGCYTDDGSPFLRTVLSAVKGLLSLPAGAAQ